MTPTIIFFGSFQTYSQLILDQLLASPLVNVAAVVTTPPQIMGKKKELTKNPVQILAETNKIPVYTPETLNEAALAEILGSDRRVDYFVTAGYGKLLPTTWLATPALGSLNLHFSLLPKFRGANPAEWALMLGEIQTGVTLIEMSPEFDTGTMIAQAALPIENQDTRETLYQKLYELGGQVLPSMIATYHSFRTGEPVEASMEPMTQSAVLNQITFSIPPVAQPQSPTPYAKRLQREDGFIPWSVIQELGQGASADSSTVSSNLQVALNHLQQPLTVAFMERASRALKGFPGLWTLIPTAKGEKRLKILSVTTENGRLNLESVQIEGQATAQWNQVKNVVQSF